MLPAENTYTGLMSQTSGTNCATPFQGKAINKSCVSSSDLMGNLAFFYNILGILWTAGSYVFLTAGLVPEAAFSTVSLMPLFLMPSYPQTLLKCSVLCISA